MNEAVFRLAGYIYDRPFASADTRFSNALRNSGAAAALLPYRMHSAGTAGDTAASSPATAAGNAITGLAIVGGNIVVTFGDGSTEDVPLPPSIGSAFVTSVVYDSLLVQIDVTYSDGRMVQIPLSPPTGLAWPGL